MAAGLALAVTAACRKPAEPTAFVVDDAVKVGADGRLLSLVTLDAYERSNPAWDGRAIRLRGARGETVAFQVVVRSGARELTGMDVVVSDLSRDGGGRIDAGQLSRFREWYLHVTVPSTSPGGSAGKGEYPDALIPAGTPGWGLPLTVARDRAQAVWIDCAIPRAAAPGTYRGEVKVLGAGRTIARFEVALEVRDFAIPLERHLPWRIGYSGWEEVPAQLGLAEDSPGWLALERDLYRLVWEGHRAVPTTHYHPLRLDAEGAGSTLSIDWRRFDRRFGPYLDGSAFADRVPVNVFSLPVNLVVGWPTRAAGEGAGAPGPGEVEARPGRRADEATLEAAARLVGRHWDEQGWRLDDAFVYVADEPSPDRYDSIRRACAALRRGDGRIRTSVAFYTELAEHAPELARAFAGLVTNWELAGDYADLPAVRGGRSPGDRIGVYQGGEPFQGGEALDDDGLALTTWPWIAWRYGLDALYLYNMTEWTYFRLDRAKVKWAGGKREIWENPLNQSWATNSQGVLLYPGRYVGVRGVVASIRLKQVRRGLQDYEYLWLARERGRRDVADAVARRLVPRALHDAGPPGKLGARGAWQRDPRAWAAAREELARAIGGAAAVGVRP